MFDIGFSELAVIAVVALVVLGPERLPRVARTAGHLLGRFQRYVSQVKSDISREMDLADLKKMQTEIESAAKGIESTVTATFGETQKELAGAGEEIKKVGEEIQQAAAGVNLMAGWPSQQPSAELANAEPAHVKAANVEAAIADTASAPETPSQQLELGFETPSRGDGRSV